MNEPECLQWHHRKSEKPKFETGWAISRKVVKAGKKLNDIELLCANCHIYANIRDGTYTGKGWMKNL